MQVLKFGGTSVANTENINKTIAIVKQSRLKSKTVVVVSALGGTTDMLIEAVKMASSRNEAYKDKLRSIEHRHLQIVRELIPVEQQSSTLSQVKKKCNDLESICEGVFLLQELTLRTLDNIMCYGELLSSLILSASFNSMGWAHQWIDARELIRTNSSYGNAFVDVDHTYTTIRNYMAKHSQQLYIIPGFIAADAHGTTTTLGRGGSDYTAALIAAATDATVLEIWTDVSGMMTADPRLVNNAKIISNISYQEAMELSHFGAKVIYPPTIQPVMNKGIPVWIKNTFAPNDYGTLIERSAESNKNHVSGISSISKIALLNLEGTGMVGVPGISKRLFEALSNEKINVILITQASSEYSICVAVDEANASKAKAAIDTQFESEIAFNKVDPVYIENDLSIIALVGENMKNHTGISGKMFGVLGRNGINIRAIAQGSSEKNISTVIKTADVKKAVNVLHEDFFETVHKELNLFLAGSGNVGGKLIEQIKLQTEYIANQLHLNLRVIGITSSKKMLLNEDGINLTNWKDQLQQAPAMQLDAFTDFIIEKNLRNSVFVDITANELTAGCYATLLKKSISIVACNKIACSSSYENYKQLKELAQEFNTAFLYETNVGASLPIIGTLNDLLRSGDKINRMEAVLSGTLNFVFNNYDGTAPFADVVKQAQDEGYTEPDPRLDLSGKDVMRKILILSREAGYIMEMHDIQNNSFLPASCMEGSVDDFYKELKKHEEHFKSLYKEAADKECKLKFVAKLENGKASVGLQHISKEQDMFHLYGKDNVVLFFTNRYTQQPLVIKGAGAGADVTASGIFADIIRTARI
ncbi:MAG: bifunctional aspartate kinase/homoserine dehydrogenase I [Bacteroidota bacterium]